jgi:5-(carboxyamino)imidazole ribonucleotide synthase
MMFKRDNGPLPPGSTIGILGGGQLARMLAQAASRIGLNCHVYAPDAESCALDVVKRATVAPYSDQDALSRFARDCDVITYEFENVPSQTASFLSQRKPVLPDPRVLATTQDRMIEKEFVGNLEIATAPHAPVSDASQLFEAVRKVGLPAILKTRRFGYDGKGQYKIDAGGDPAAAWRAVNGASCILEGFVPFEREISVVVARGRDGSLQSFDVTENEHRDHILKVSRVPAAIPDPVAGEAVRIAESIATAFDYVGVLAVEMFVMRSGMAQRVLVNEIAPRVHNSGHWTIDGCSVSQFEQHIRAIAGWPLAVPVRLGRVEMINLIGAEAADYGRWLTVPGASLHLYGKGDPVPGRKMGHVTRVQAD